MIFSNTALEGKRFIVTGATGGAGSATTKLIELCGGTVVPWDARKEKVDDLLEGPCPFDGIFHAAGMERIRLLSPTSIWHTDFNMCGLLTLLNHHKEILAQGASVVAMSSVAAIRGTAGMTLYGADKGAIEGFVRSAAVELAPRRIRVNALRAGAFQSKMHERITRSMTPAAIDGYAGRHLLGFGRAEDIAHAAVFLLSDAGRWVSGTTMTIDGGFSVK